MHAHGESITAALHFFVIQRLGEGRKEGPSLVLIFSRNPHIKTVVVRRAQVANNPGLRVSTIQKRTAKKSLGLRSPSRRDTSRVLSSAARQLASYTEPGNT